MDDDVRNKLRREVMSCHWEDLAQHQQRGALLLLLPELDLLDVAEAMARDDKQRVTGWLKRGALRRAGEADRVQYEHESDEVSEVRFQFVIVQPWVLAQALS